jgi:hypothetical protein
MKPEPRNSWASVSIPTPLSPVWKPATTFRGVTGPDHPDGAFGAERGRMLARLFTVAINSAVATGLAM